MKPVFCLLLLFSLVFGNCKTDDREAKKEQERNFLFLALLMQQNPGVYDSADCQLYYSLNPLYVPGGYAERFISDGRQYENVALGDSTMDISKDFAGFYDPSRTQINAVSGDTLCDYRSRFRRSVNTNAPKNLVISTVGGNDILRNTPRPILEKTFEDLYSNLKTRFPDTKFSFVEVHPTFVTSANAVRKSITASLKSKSPGACWVDPDPCFSDPLKESEMLDAIHYAEAPALCVKNRLLSTCGVSL